MSAFDEGLLDLSEFGYWHQVLERYSRVFLRHLVARKLDMHTYYFWINRILMKEHTFPSIYIFIMNKNIL